MSGPRVPGGKKTAAALQLHAEGRTTVEIAARLGLAVSDVWHRLERAGLSPKSARIAKAQD